MLLREFLTLNKNLLSEGGNLQIGDVAADRIDSSKRAQIVPTIDVALNAINAAFKKVNNNIPLWMPSLLASKKFLAGSSFHFFNRLEISDADFARVKRTVGDIDTQVDKNMVDQVRNWLGSLPAGVSFGPAQYVGMDDKDPSQILTLWKFPDIVVTDANGQEKPITIQIDLEMKPFSSGAPTSWAQFSASSDWNDLSQGIKGVFHKWIIRSLGALTQQTFLLRKIGARKTTEKPTTDNMISFAVKSKEGGGLRAKYQPVIDPATGQQEIKDNLPVYTELPTSGYEQDISNIFSTIFGDRLPEKQIKSLEPKFWSYTGIVELMKDYLDPREQQKVADGFLEIVFGKGSQRLYKDSLKQDLQEKNAAVNKMYEILGVNPPEKLNQMVADYTSGFKEQPAPVTEDDKEQAGVKAQLRKGMPHLRDLKPADFLDLVDELQDEGGRFKLQNIPLNVKIDGFGGRFGKDASGKPFMATSRTEPRYKAGFLDYHKEKGTTDPEILGRAANFDKLFNEMMAAIKFADSKLGPDFLVNKQVTCEVLFLPFATQTEEGKLKFVGIEYDQLPAGVELVLVPFRVVEADSGKEIPNGDEIVQELAELGQQGNVMFMSNRLVQKDGLDVTEIINPLENLEELKRIVSDTTGKRDRASLQLRREIEEKLKPVQIALEKAIDEDPNIIGKDLLGQNYEGIVINSRLGPIKITSQRQKDIIAQKQALKKNAKAERSRENQNKTAVVAIGSFVGHKGHEELLNFTINKAKELGGDPYLFIGNAEGKDDPIPPAVKVQTWHKLYPELANNISTVQIGGSLMQKIKHELINPLPGKPPRYDNIVIMVGEDRKDMPIANALMKAVNKFSGYEHVKVQLEVTPRGTGMSFTKLRNILKDPNATPEQQYELWSQGFDEAKLGKDWILNLMDITRKGMGVTQQPVAPLPKQTVAERLFNSLVRPKSKNVKKKKDMEENDNMTGGTAKNKPGLGFQTYAMNHIAPAAPRESMLPKNAFAGTESPWKHKLGPAAHAKGKQKGPVRRGQLVGSLESAKKEIKKSTNIPVSEDAENIMNALIERIIVNEAIQNKNRKY